MSQTILLSFKCNMYFVLWKRHTQPRENESIKVVNHTEEHTVYVQIEPNQISPYLNHIEASN